MPANAPLDIDVELGARSYRVRVGHGISKTTAAEMIRPGEHLLVSEPRVMRQHGQTLTHLLGTKIKATLIVPSGEQSKSPSRLIRLVEDMLAARIDRRTHVIAFGGGVIGDLAGCAAALALRGLPLIHIPTTLLAQVDSAIGGKTGVNSRLGKNLIGVFYQPRGVICDTAWLASLPAREMRAGYAEIYKYALLGDAAFLTWLETNAADVLRREPAALAYAIATCCRHKARITSEDERDNDRRALLNLGHTFAHALEQAQQYRRALIHGEAVAMGIVMAAHLSAHLGMIARDDVVRIRHHLKATGLPTRPASLPPWPDFIATMRRDKKAEEGRLTFVLLRALGQAEVVTDVHEGAVRQAVAAAMAESC
ncbi:MAG: 3-dehydroquinate synthase [Pseudomonadota bacterium]